MSLMESMNILGKDASLPFTYLPFTYSEYLNGYTFCAWNLTHDYLGQSQDPTREANIRLDVKFVEATSALIDILFYCVFDGTIMIVGSGLVANS